MKLQVGDKVRVRTIQEIMNDETLEILQKRETLLSARYKEEKPTQENVMINEMLKAENRTLTISEVCDTIFTKCYRLEEFGVTWSWQDWMLELVEDSNEELDLEDMI